ncbi:MAG: hypothetical protein PHD97_02510 [Bacteroidales bacterium]|nr:hypothetical protein [Bacteroidales bacterium]
MKKFVLLFASLIILANIFAQNKERAIGFRGGETFGFTYNYNPDESISIGAILKLSHNEIRFVILKENVMPVLLSHSDHLFFYNGLGVHAGFMRWEKYRSDEFHSVNYCAPLIGADFVVGLEYRFFKYPFSVGAEYKPYVDLFGEKFFSLRLFDFGGTIKYNF